jgi:hypothetical protein
MNGPYYLGKFPRTKEVVVLTDMDYRYQRLHERRLRVPNPEHNFVLLAQGSEKLMKQYRNLMRV